MNYNFIKICHYSPKTTDRKLYKPNKKRRYTKRRIKCQQEDAMFVKQLN